MTKDHEKRRFLRHPVECPIEIRPISDNSILRPRTQDVSQGGVRFEMDHRLSPGTAVAIRMPVHDHLFNIEAHVVYSRKDQRSGKFHTGVVFHDEEHVFRAKMAEQILMIEKYQRELNEQTATPVSEEEAARRWIEKYSRRFAELFKTIH